MPTEEDRAQLAATMRDLITQFVYVDPESVARSRDLGTAFDFSAVLPALREVSVLAERLSGYPLERLPYRVLQNMHSAFSPVHAQIQRVQQFKVPADQAVDVNALRTKQVRAFEAAKDTFLDAITPIVGFAAAYMSTIATHLNWGASYLVNDVYRRFLKPQGSDKHYVNVSRATTV